MSLPVCRLAALLIVALVPAGCGAGLITGIVASNGDENTPPPVAAPELNLPDSRFPLVPGDNAATLLRTVLVANTQVPATARLEVQIAALGLTVDQESPVIVSGPGTSTSIGFVLRTAPFAAVLVDPTLADIPAEFAVLVDGRAAAPAVPVTLLRQPAARLYRSSPEFLSPLGGQRVTLAVRGLQSQSAANLTMAVRTADPSGLSASVTRLCARLQIEEPDPLLPAPAPDEALVSAEVPGNTFAGPAELFVEDVVAGRSREVVDTFYRPDVAVALPGQGPTTGGTLVTLIGRALVPLDFGTGVPVPAFERIELLFRKGGREVALPRQDLRTAESSLDRLVFTIPPSPDARPGRVDIVLRALLGTTPAEVIADRVFLFGNPQPTFGPRGAVLDRAPVALTPIQLEGAPAGNEVPDYGVLFEEGGVGFLQLLVGQENGMFQRFGQVRRIGDPEVEAERDPRALVAGDFDGDGVPDLVVVNAGATTAVNHVVLGQAAPRAPLGALHRVAGVPGAARAVAVDFDGDGRQDLLLLPGSGAAPGSLPQLLMSRSTPGYPLFVPGPTVPVRAQRFDAMTVADVDGDGFVDLVFGRGNTLPGVDIAFGDGMGGFSGSGQVDLVLPGYQPDPGSPAVGIHRIREQPLPALALVFAGLSHPAPPHPSTPPLVAVLHQSQPRTFAQPTAADVLVAPVDSLAVSMAADLDRTGTEELVIAVAGDAAALPLALLRYNGVRFEPVPEGVQFGAEQFLSIRELHFEVAIPIAPPRTRESMAVFVVHETETDGFRERRLSTLLVFSGSAGTGLSLLAPDVGAPIDNPVLGIVAANLTSLSAGLLGRAFDLALAWPGFVRVLANDGVGGFFAPVLSLAETGLLPSTVVRLTAAPGQADALAFCTVDGRIGVWRPDPQLPSPQPATRLGPDLRPLVAPGLATVPIDARTRLRAADLDGDGISDLTVMLAFSTSPLAEGDTVLLALRGKPAPAAGEFPFELPAGPGAAMPVHGNASSFALGDFAADGAAAPVRLELALAVPRGTTPGAADGDHVRFYRLESNGAGGLRWARTFDSGGAQVLLAGNAPTLVEAKDFDGNGTIDLLVAAGGDASLRLFLNSGQPAAAAGQFAIEALRESFASPRPTAAGTPRVLLLGDINGDGNVDVLLTTEAQDGLGRRSTSVGFYLSSGTGSFDGPAFVSPTRLGNRDGSLVADLGDCNGDGVPDLPVGWDTSGAGDRNLRVLFAGSR